MSKRKTIEELESMAKKAEEKARKLRETARMRTKAEEAKTNSEIIANIRDWWNSIPEGNRPKWDRVPEMVKDLL